MNRVLIADDEKHIRLTIKRAIEELDIEVHLAVDGLETLEMVKTVRPDLILLDIKMPGMNGMEVLRKLRTEHHDTRVVMISAHGTIEDAVEALKLGAIDFLRKPFTPGEIRQVVQDGLKRKEGFFSRLFTGALKPPPEPVLPSPPGAPDPVSSVKKDLPQADQNDQEITGEDFLQMTKDAIERMDFERAERSAKHAIARDPSMGEAYNILGVLEELKGNSDMARKYYRAALAIDPKSETARSNLDRSDKRKPGKKFFIKGVEHEQEKTGK